MTRRGKGEGCLYRRSDGRWAAVVDLGWHAGRRRRKFIFARTRAAAHDALVRALRLRDQGIVAGERQTVAQFLAAWLQAKCAQLRPRTFESYETTIRHHVLPGLGHVRLSRLAAPQIAQWFRAHQAAGASARTIRYARAVLRTALAQAVRWRVLDHNPASLVEPPRYATRPIRPLTPDEARHLLQVAARHRLGALVTVATALGLRLGEALALRWADVDFDAGTLQVTHTLTRTGGDPGVRRQLVAERRALLAEWRATPPRSPARRALAQRLAALRDRWRATRTTLQLAEPKSARSRRTVALPHVVISALRAHRTRQLEERLAAGRYWQETGFIFTTPLGTPLDPRNVHRWFRQLLAEAGLPPIRFHDLRHTAATLLLVQGVDVRTIMATLGHSQIGVTLDTYAHVLPALQRAAADRIDDLLG